MNLRKTQKSLKEPFKARSALFRTRTAETIYKRKTPRNLSTSGHLSWSCYPDSNWRPHPYQGCALPTELYQRNHSSVIIPQFPPFGKRFLQKNLDFCKKVVFYERTPPVCLRRQPPRRWGLWQYGQLSGFAKGSLSEGAGIAQRWLREFYFITRSGRSAGTGTCGCAACGSPLPRSGAHAHG